VRALKFFLVIFSSFLISSIALSAGKKSAAGGESFAVKSPSSSKSGRSVLVGFVASGFSENLAHFEYNIANEIGLGLEVGFMTPHERMSDKEVDEKGESFVTRGNEVLLTVSNYSRPSALGGFYWTLGAGYQSSKTSWKKKPETKESGERTALVDSSGRYNHELEAKGATGHGRVGYRFVAETWPFAIGGFLGVKHFQGAYSDSEQEGEDGYSLAPTNSTEQKTAQRRNMTSAGLGLEVGLAF